MKLTKEQVEDNLKSYKNGYWGGGIKEFLETALTLYAELEKAKADLLENELTRNGLRAELAELREAVAKYVKLVDEFVPGNQHETKYRQDCNDSFRILRKLMRG